MWCIPAEGNAHFVCQMEAVLGVYKRPFDPEYPVACMDETSVQCVKEVRPAIAPRPGERERYDVEYQRNGVAHLLLFYAPFDNWRRYRWRTVSHAACKWAEGVHRLVQEDYPQVRRSTLVMDNLNIHIGASLYKAFCT